MTQNVQVNLREDVLSIDGIQENIISFLSPEDNRNMRLISRSVRATHDKFNLLEANQNWRAVPGKNYEEKSGLVRRMQSSYKMAEVLNFKRIGPQMPYKDPDYNPKNRLEHRRCPIRHAQPDWSVREFVLFVDSQGSPYLKRKGELNPEEVKQGKSKERIDKIRAIFKSTCDIVQAFGEKPLDERYPWQDLRNRLFFLQRLEDEYTCMRAAASDVAIIFQEEPEFASLAYTLATANRDYTPNELAFLGRTTIEDGTKQYSITIRGKVPPSENDGETFEGVSRLILVNGESKIPLRSMDIARVWWHADYPLQHYENRKPFFEPEEGLKLSRNTTLLFQLYVRDWRHFTEQQQNNAHGNRPIETLIIQLAVEIFTREPDLKMRFTTDRCMAPILAAMGFEGNESDQLREEVFALRNQDPEDLQMFPRLTTEDREVMFHLEKFLDSKTGKIKIGYRREDTLYEATFLGQTFETRNEVIAYDDFFENGGRLLAGNPNDRILPEFIARDLRRFEDLEPPQMNATLLEEEETPIDATPLEEEETPSTAD